MTGADREIYLGELLADALEREVDLRSKLEQAEGDLQVLKGSYAWAIKQMSRLVAKNEELLERVKKLRKDLILVSERHR